MAPRFWFFSSALLFLSASAWSQQAPAPSSAVPAVPIVQPGAPGENSKIVSAASVSSAAREPAEADTKFMQGMIMHHSQAVEMTALLRTRSHNKAVQALGKR